MKNLYATLLAAAVWVGSAGAAEAAIQSVDWNAAVHDQWLTRDTASGLDWLDVSLTAGQSMSQVLGGDWVARGFRYATSQEVTTLFEHADVTGGALPQGELDAALSAQGFLTYNQGGVQSRTLSQMLGGMESSTPDLLGPSLDGLTGTDAQGGAISFGNPFSASGLSVRVISLYPWSFNGWGNASPAYPYPPSVPTLCTLVCEDQTWTWGSPGSYIQVEGADITLRVIPGSTQIDYLGSYLVRDTAAVPEPGTWALLLAGAAAMATIALRRPR